MISTRHVLCVSTLALALVACSSGPRPGEQYRSDVYAATQVNQAQEVQTVDIISLQPAKISIPASNRGGYYYFYNAPSRVKQYVDGVQITFRVGDKHFNSAQVGQICEYRIGPALMVSTSPISTRIQPNNPNGCGDSPGNVPEEENL